MSDGVPKSRVTLVYDTKQPEGREKRRISWAVIRVRNDLSCIRLRSIRKSSGLSCPRA